MYQVHSITNRDSNAACKETVDNDDDLVSSSVQDTYKIQKKNWWFNEPLTKQRIIQHDLLPGISNTCREENVKKMDSENNK